MAENKIDSAPVLFKGMSRPWVNIYNALGDVITDPFNNDMPIGAFVTEFEYIYDEEKNDKGTLTIETNNPALLDLEDLQYEHGLQIQWGHLYPNGTIYAGPTRKVVITDHDIEWGDKGVKIRLEFSDYSVFLKNATANHYNNTEGFIEYVKDIFRGVPIGVALVDYNPKEIIKPVVVKKEADLSNPQWSPQKFNSYDPNLQHATGSPLNSLTVHSIHHNPTQINPDAVGVSIMEYNPSDPEQASNLWYSDEYRKVYLKETIAEGALIIGTSRNKYKQIKDTTRSLPNGPFFVDSRDDQMIIHNAKRDRPLYKVYTYAGGNGELLQFHVKASFVRNSTEVKEDNEVDPDSKDLLTTFTQGISVPDQGNVDKSKIDTYLNWPSLTGYLPAAVPLGQPFNNQFVKPYAYPPELPEGKTCTYTFDASGQTTVVDGKDELVADNAKTFSSYQEAKKYFTSHVQVTQQEIRDYFNQWKAEFDKADAYTSIGALSNKVKTLDHIPPYRVTRRVKLEVNDIHVRYLAEAIGLPSNPSDNFTEAFINKIQTGEIDLNNYTVQKLKSSTGGYIPGHLVDVPEDENLLGDFNVLASTLEKHLNAKVTLTSQPVNRWRDKKETATDQPVLCKISMFIDLSIPINGEDIAVGADQVDIPGVIENDIIESITNQVKATADVVGDPALESSMNIYVQNIGAKYSGIWYTKKVTHTINRDGYKCQIEFVQRTIPIQTATVKSKVTTQSLAGIAEVAKLAKETGSHLKQASLEFEVREARRALSIDKDMDISLVVQVDPTTGKVNKVNGVDDLVSANFVEQKGEIIYRVSEDQSLMQDLQKRLNGGQ